MQLFEGKLTILKRGCNSEILLVERGDLQVVIKIVEVGAIKQVAHLLNQWSVLSRLDHSNIVEVYHCLKKVTIPAKEGIYYILAQEYAQFGNLSELIRRHPNDLSFANRRFLFWELARAVQYLHCKDVVHRDLKLDNVLVCQHQEGLTLKLGDFGFAETLEPNQPLIGCFKGTRRGYMAPQIHACKENSDLKYNGKGADMFALGVILFAMVMGRLPFEFAVADDRHYKLLMGQSVTDFWSALAPNLAKLQEIEDSMIEEFKDLFVGLVKYNAKERLTIEEVLQHPWMMGKKERPAL